MSIDKIDFVDKVLTCLDCGREFTFTTGEQRYFWAKGLSEPKRCKPCRMLRKRSLVSILNIEEEHNGNNPTS
jgi:hypothetical protein